MPLSSTRFEHEGATTGFVLEVQRKICDRLRGYIGEIDVKLREGV